MPSPWNEPVVEASAEAVVKPYGRSLAISAPAGWPEGARVRLLLLPQPK